MADALQDVDPSLRGVVLRRLLVYLRPFAKELVFVLGLVLVSAATQALGPYLIGRAIDGAIGAGDGPALDRTMLMLLVVYVAGAVASRAQFIAIGSIGQRTLAQMRTEIFSTVQRLSLRFFDRQPAGDLMSRLVNDTDVLNQLFSQGLVQILGSIFGLAGILIAMLALNWQLALASFIVIPAMLLATRLFARLSRRAFRRTRESLGDVSSEIQEEIAGVKIAQAFNRTGVNQQRFAQRNAANRDANVSATAITSAFTPTIDVLSAVATAIVAGYGGYLALGGSISVGVVIAFLTYVQQFFRPIQTIATFATTVQASLAAAERIFDLLDTPADLTDAPGARAMPPIAGQVVFDHVSFSYGARPGGEAATQALTLDDVSLVAEPGETIAIVGPTGAGKTTLVNMLGRFYDVDGGAVRIDGTDIREVTRASLRAQMGVVLQD
ncbi:ABC transporter, partial [Kouleothrix aurantiaca]